MSEPTPPPNTPPASLPSNTPVAAPPPPAKKNNLLVRGGLGCLGLMVLACVGFGALVYYGTWQQEQNYNAGHAAYQKADCATAVGPLGKAASGDPGDKDSDVAAKAQAELEECEALQSAGDLGGTSLGDSVLAYRDFAEKYPESPLKPIAIQQGAAVFTSNPPEQVANSSLCNALDNLTEAQLITSVDEQIPGLLIACGAAYEAEQDYTSAVAAYNRFRQEYPDHASAAQVEEAYVRATLAEADALGAGALPSPQAVGSSENTGTATVIIQNDSPEALSMVFSG
ncbi:MAG TPA: hypothetical protein VFT99_04205, partial [Roseiflexaceae bacterium]|nr:hypothetical protein [Roseiflexaceae bacterium]